MSTYVPGTQEKDLSKVIMSLQAIGSLGDTTSAAATTNTANIATNTAAIAAFSGAWAAWSPTFTMSTVGGTPITAATSGTGARYVQVGKMVVASLDATISNIGVGNNGAFIFSLPVTAFNASSPVGGSGVEVSTVGKFVTVQLQDTTHATTKFYDNTSLLTGGNGTRVQLMAIYEAA